MLVAGILLLLAGLAYVQEKQRTRGAIAAMLVLLLVHTPLMGGLGKLLTELVLPYRDTVAHVLAIGGLLLCERIRCRGHVNDKALVLPGLLIGWAAWCRLPDFLIILPAGLSVLLTARLSPGNLLRRICFLGLSFGIGLMPIVAQNLFEGKAWLMAGQAESLAKIHDPIVLSSGLKKGLNPENFTIIFPASLQHIYHLFTPGMQVLLVPALLLGIIKRTKFTLVMICGALVMLLFYSCYDKVVSRYLVPVALLLLPLTGLLLADVVLKTVDLITPHLQFNFSVDALLLQG